MECVIFADSRKRMSSKTILVTGSAGFIGFHLSQKLLTQNHKVVGFDNVNDYYDVYLKEALTAILKKSPNFVFIKGALKILAHLKNPCNPTHFHTVVTLPP